MPAKEPTVEQIAAQLQQRVVAYPPTSWGRKQSDAWDRQTNFVYRTHGWDELHQKVGALDKAVADYAVNRWFNFWSAMAVERIFCTLPGVRANTNQYHRLVDFSIQGINFDHKTSVFPKNYTHSPKFAWYNKAHLISWLYQNQSRQQRYHSANRLFIMLYARNGEHWKLRAEVEGLRQTIQTYVNRFNRVKLVQVSVDSHMALSDIIWFVK